MNRDEAIQKLINAAELCADLARQDEKSDAFLIEAQAMEYAGSVDIEGMKQRIRDWQATTPKWKDVRVALQALELVMQPFESERANK